MPVASPRREAIRRLSHEISEARRKTDQPLDFEVGAVIFRKSSMDVHGILSTHTLELKLV